MNKLQILLVSLVIGSGWMGWDRSAQADTRQVRCDFYPRGEDRASDFGQCSFSQRQGYITIQRKDGRRYEFRPVGDQPGNFVDQSGAAVYRQGGLGDAGVIFRLPEESIYIYWNSSMNDNVQGSSSSETYTPETYTTVQNLNEIAIQITEGEFQFYGILKRGETGSFWGNDGRVEVIFNPRNGHVVVTNQVTGTEFYNYYTDPIPDF